MLETLDCELSALELHALESLLDASNEAGPAYLATLWDGNGGLSDWT